MKAIKLYGKNDIRLETDIPVPEIENDNEVLIEVAWCGICGSDVKRIKDGHNYLSCNSDLSSTFKAYSLFLGHEISGIVKSIGEKVVNVKIGDRVVIDSSNFCGIFMDHDNLNINNTMKALELSKVVVDGNNSDACGCCSSVNSVSKGGGLAEYVVYEAHHVVKISNKIPLDIAALMQPLAACWHAVEKSHFKKGEEALVIGGGPSGIGVLQCLDAMGAEDLYLADPDLNKRRRALRFNDCCTFDYMNHDLRYIKHFSTDAKGFHTVFGCSELPSSFDAAIASLRPGGIAMWSPKLVNNCNHKNNTPDSACYNSKDFQNVLHSLECGMIDPMKTALTITHKYTLEGCIDNKILHTMEADERIIVTPRKSLNLN
ncbi:hypothetical protein PACTADRAFT_37869 [Pachysolen tannophilus NRRL Y-2460]|uniref:Alcohol dehydrogenase-like N-terminal domain-containing protein n=1 Tax=Pachysolen tannophilus NRRL Y-2460 TaxID=669874 RepID=A0A1E4U1C2_PACTA|nr:hypothetical protein PACTADRAFT_37869 [Pachysolen tannophilus NRRL Y-2460]